MADAAQGRDDGVVRTDVGLAVQLLHAVEGSQGFLGEALLAEDLDDLGDCGGADEGLVCAEEAP